MSINRDLEELIFATIMELADGLTDDIFQEYCEDPDKIDEAIDHIIDKLERYREDGEL